MLFGDGLDDDVRVLIRQWKTAEERIKQAENVNGEVVAAAIFEMRYAGRKVVEALQLAVDKDCKNDGTTKQKFIVALAEARECCIKAKHDAIDSVLTFLTIWFQRAQDRLSVKAITKFFPDYLNKRSNINRIKQKIAQSRGERLEAREQIYDEIAKEEFSGLLDIFNTMSESADLVETEIRKERRNKIIYVCFTIFTVLLAASGWVSTLRHWNDAANNRSIVGTPAHSTRPQQP